MVRRRQSGGEAEEGGTRSPGAPVEPSFEEALAELEGVVAQLESGDMPLEQALLAFESGIRLSRRCASTLDAAERRVEILMAGRPGGALRVEPFGAADDELEEIDAVDELDELEPSEAGDDEPDDERRSR